MASGKRHKNRKIVKYRRPINIGVVFFGFVAVYLIVCIYMFFNSSHISGYEVMAGTLATDYHYTGVALRSERVFTSEKAGYISYYAREGEKVSHASTVYTVDENGQMSETLQNNASEVQLSEEDYSTLRSEISSYSTNMADMDFKDVYNFKNSMNSNILDMINTNMTEQLDSALTEDSGLFTKYNAETSGVVEYYTDGFEDATVDTLSADWFDKEKYSRKDLKSEELVSSGDPVYKLITEEAWTLIFPLDEELETYLVNKITNNVQKSETGETTQLTTYIQVRFDDDDQEVWPSVTVEYRDNKAYGVLKFINSMVRYAGERYLDFEVIRDETSGLKIPNSAVTEKEFYVIPVAYLTQANDENGFMKQVTEEDGTTSISFEEVTIYYQDEEYVYVDPKEEDFSTSGKKLETGDYVMMPDSADNYQIGKMESLKGVYNINKGYTVFRQIHILYENEEYCIAEEGTAFGLSVYDHIVLNGDSVSEDEVIY